MKKFAVYYRYPVENEAIIKAKTQKEAEKKLKEVLGEDIEITVSWELKDDNITL